MQEQLAAAQKELAGRTFEARPVGMVATVTGAKNWSTSPSPRKWSIRTMWRCSKTSCSPRSARPSRPPPTFRGTGRGSPGDLGLGGLLG